MSFERFIQTYMCKPRGRLGVGISVRETGIAIGAAAARKFNLAAGQRVNLWSDREEQQIAIEPSEQGTYKLRGDISLSIRSVAFVKHLQIPLPVFAELTKNDQGWLVAKLPVG